MQLFQGVRKYIFKVVRAFFQKRERVAAGPTWRRTYTEILLTKGQVAVEFVLKQRVPRELFRPAGKIFLAKPESNARRARFNLRSSSIYERLNRMRSRNFKARGLMDRGPEIEDVSHSVRGD
jgi:hypothetical protein